MKFYSLLNHEPEPHLQEIEVSSSFQIPSFQIVGLPAREVSEAKERIRAAIQESDLEFPKRRVVVNLHPADVHKKGTGVDLAMALAILDHHGGEAKNGEKVLAWGELSLNGEVRPSEQILRAVYAGWKNGVSRILLSEADALTARVKRDWIARSQIFKRKAPKIIGVKTLKEAWIALRENPKEGIALPEPTEATPPRPPLFIMAHSLQRVIMAAAAGHHHLLLLGPKGAGKSHALEWLSELLPPAPDLFQLQRELTAEILPHHFRVGSGRCRRVLPQIRPSALLGYASTGRYVPGELALAHGGILVADEFPEWSRDTRETLREPMERASFSLTRQNARVEVETNFLLAATGNLCPCGGWPDHLGTKPMFPLVTRCDSPGLRCREYLSRLSGPVLDRIDIVTLIQQRPMRVLNASKELIDEVQARVLTARQEMIRSWGKPAGSLHPEEIEFLLATHRVGEAAFASCTSLRSRHKIARVAWSLALLDRADHPGPEHFLEASQYRADRVI